MTRWLTWCLCVNGALVQHRGGQGAADSQGRETTPEAAQGRLQAGDHMQAQEPCAAPDWVLAGAQRFFGTAVGKGRQAAKTEIERLKLLEISCEQGINEVAKMCACRLLQADALLLLARMRPVAPYGSGYGRT